MIVKEKPKSYKKAAMCCQRCVYHEYTYSLSCICLYGQKLDRWSYSESSEDGGLTYEELSMIEVEESGYCDFFKEEDLNG